MKIELKFQGEPRAVQSVRFARIGNFIRKYQPKQVVEWKGWIKLQAMNQLARVKGFQPFGGPVGLTADFVFSLPKSARKADKEAVEAGLWPVWKDTRPDLGDNLVKGMADALTGIVWKDDSQICEIHSRKIYGVEPHIRITVSDFGRDGQ